MKSYLAMTADELAREHAAASAEYETLKAAVENCGNYTVSKVD